MFLIYFDIFKSKVFFFLNHLNFILLEKQKTLLFIAYIFINI